MNKQEVLKNLEECFEHVPSYKMEELESIIKAAMQEKTDSIYISSEIVKFFKS